MKVGLFWYESWSLLIIRTWSRTHTRASITACRFLLHICRSLFRMCWSLSQMCMSLLHICRSLLLFPRYYLHVCRSLRMRVSLFVCKRWRMLVSFTDVWVSFPYVQVSFTFCWSLLMCVLVSLCASVEACRCLFHTGFFYKRVRFFWHVIRSLLHLHQSHSLLIVCGSILVCMKVSLCASVDAHNFFFGVSCWCMQVSFAYM